MNVTVEFETEAVVKKLPVIVVNFSPTVNLTAATNISTSTATLNGNITSTGRENPTVTFYWGTTDGGTTTESWDHNSSLGTKGVEAFTKNIGQRSGKPGTA